LRPTIFVTFVATIEALPPLLTCGFALPADPGPPKGGVSGLCPVGYGLFTADPKTRHDRVGAVKDNRPANAQDDLKTLLIVIRDACERHGADGLAAKRPGPFQAARYGRVGEAKNRSGTLP
jgi:hypothetical protein